MNEETALCLLNNVRNELIVNILPFWIKKMTDPGNGGYFGRMDGNNQIIDAAPKGGILNARILWTFSSAYRSLKNPDYLKSAERAKDYIFAHFFDQKYGGTYWSVTDQGQPLDTKKQIYSQAFFIYALSEYFLATGDETCRNEAIKQFYLIEKYSFDPVQGGYFEAYDQEWHLLEDLRLSHKDANEKKTMNTHLHILEAYTNLYRIWNNEFLASRLRNLISLFLDTIINQETAHLNLFFDENWTCKSAITSFGHDIECSWLLYEAGRELKDKLIFDRVKNTCLRIAEATMQGLQPDGSLIYEKDNVSGHTDFDRHWWAQAEAVVGFYNAFEMSGENKFLLQSEKSFNYINNNLIDKINGEWYWSIKNDGTINRVDDKAGFWKCPYHNGRMCLELMSRIQSA